MSSRCHTVTLGTGMLGENFLLDKMLVANNMAIGASPGSFHDTTLKTSWGRTRRVGPGRQCTTRRRILVETRTLLCDPVANNM